MNTPKEIVPHAPKYNNNSWQDYTLQELGNWVHLFSKRATHRADPEKRQKDLVDARNYWLMMGSHIDQLEGK